MKKSLVAAVAAFFAVAPIAGAGAVDLINEDNESRMVMVTTGDQGQDLTVEAGQEMTGVCEACTIQVGDTEAVEAAGEDVVFIRDGMATKN